MYVIETLDRIYDRYDQVINNNIMYAVTITND